MVIVWLERCRLGCVILILIPVVLGVVLSRHDQGVAFTLGYLTGSVALCGGIPFVLWTLLIMVVRAMLIRRMTAQEASPSVSDSAGEGTIDSGADHQG